MKAVIKEQLHEISELQKENEELKLQVENIRRSSVTSSEVPDFLIAKHIEVNKEALSEDLKEATEQIAELEKALKAKQREKELLAADDAALLESTSDANNAALFATMDSQQRAEAMEAKLKQRMVVKMTAVAENEREVNADKAELTQLREIQTKLEARLADADKNLALDEERIRNELAAKVEAERMAIEEKAKKMEVALRAAEAQSRAREEERQKREEELQEELRRKEATMRKEEDLREQMSAATAEENAELQQQMARLQQERREQDAEIEKARQASARLVEVQKEARAAIEAQGKQEQELAALKAQMAQMERDAAAKAQDEPARLQKQLQSTGQLYEPSAKMLAKAEIRLSRDAKGKRHGDAEAVGRILETLPVLSACNDLLHASELEPSNRTLFQSLGGVAKLVDYLRPKGQNAPYATIVARTLPCVLDAAGRTLFHKHASEVDKDGELRYRYLLSLLQSADPDDQENACLAIHGAATDCDDVRKACFDHGISAQVFGVLQEQSALPIPRQRLQRVVVMAMSELASGYEPYKELVRAHGGVPMLLSFLSPSHDEYLIKETLQLVGRMTQNCASIQAELQRHSAVERYATLLFADMHDVQISELAALALVNLISEVPQLLATLAADRRYPSIRYALLASMARALSSSMLRNGSTAMSMAGSADFAFWGGAAVGVWEDGNAGGDRKHTSFVDNPQFLLRARPGTNLIVLLQDTLEPSRERDKVKARPLFLRLCVAAASAETVASRLKQLDLSSTGARPAAVDNDGACMLEPNVLAALDVAKTREVALRCHIRSKSQDDMWVIVPHVGCSHQHSRYVLSVFADQEVALEGELASWSKRVVCGSWSPLCCAPKGIDDARWRNCPQFQVLSVGSSPSRVHALLSYGERDEARNKRHTSVHDPPGGLGGEERPALSLYVMRARVPDRRYAGQLSPYVDEYVSHSLVTNSWCVGAGWDVEPGDVYALLAVMSEGTSREVPLRLTLYTSPTDATDVLLKPLSLAAEWHLSVLEGHTDENGMTVVDLLPQLDEPVPGGGAQSSSMSTALATQATLVMETTTPDAFCSIVTEHEGELHKVLVKYQQQHAVLPVPLTPGHFYTMTTRAINQQQAALGGIPVRLLLYSTRPVQASPAHSQKIVLAPDAAKERVCKGTSALVKYGEEAEPPDSRRQQPTTKAASSSHDPKVLTAVVLELETQRDTLYSFTRDELNRQPPAILEALREQNAELQRGKAHLEAQLLEAKALAQAAETHAHAQVSSAVADANIAASSRAATSMAQASAEAAKLSDALQKLEASEAERDKSRVLLAGSEKQLATHREHIQSLSAQLHTALDKGVHAYADGKDGSTSATEGSKEAAAREAARAAAAAREVAALNQQLIEATQESATLKSELVEARARTAQQAYAVHGGASSVAYTEVERRAEVAVAEAAKLREDNERLSEHNKKLMALQSEGVQSSACALQ